MVRERPSPRLTVLLASDAPVGVVFLRARSKLFRIVVWDRTTDTFNPGPWFRGKIYPDRSDVSPDGRHLIYFAMAGVAWAVPATGGTWTAISRLPSLTATALWGQGDTWGGGGVFTSNDSFWLEADANTSLIRDNSGLRREASPPAKSRLDRDGWDNKGTHFEKTIGSNWTLQRLGQSGGYVLERFGECNLDCSAWEWADVDRGRLVWAERGCLRTAALQPQGPGVVNTLHDFNLPFGPTLGT